MKGEFFLDTNILVYTFSPVDTLKRDRAKSLVSQALKDGTGMISWQVVQEFLNVATTKFQVCLSPQDSASYLAEVLRPLCRVFPTIEIYSEALGLRDRTGFSYYDCLIIASARQGGARTLYSEDLQHGRVIDHLCIENPFSVDQKPDNQ